MCIQIIFQMYTIYLTVHNGFLGKQMSKFPLTSECHTCHGLWCQNLCMFGIKSWQGTLPQQRPSEGPQSPRSKILRLSIIPSTKGSPSHLVFYSSATTPPSLLKLLPLSSSPSLILLQNPTYKYFSPVHWKLKGAASKQSYFHYFCGKPNCFLLKQST